MDLIVAALAGMLVGGGGMYYWQSRVRAKLVADLEKIQRMVQPQGGGPGVPTDPK